MPPRPARRRAPQQYADDPQRDLRVTTTRCMDDWTIGEQDYQRDPAYPDDPYAYQDEYDDEPRAARRSAAAA